VINRWESVRSSYWFVPALMALAAALGSFATLLADSFVSDVTPGWLVPGGVDGARQMLGTIAGSMITVAGVVFSITIVAFSLASQQFGPMLLYNFMRDRVNQVVLGTFVATFLYCILVLRAVNDSGALPSISIAIALLLAVLSLGVLIYFIHHIAQTVRVPVLLARVRCDLERSIDRLFPESIEDEVDTTPAALPRGFDERACTVATQLNGYVQAIDEHELCRLLAECELVAQLARRPHDYVVAGETLLCLFPDDRVDDDIVARVRECITIGAERTVQQDVVHGVEQIAQVALRALSPALNDPHTGNACIDELSAVMAHLAHRKLDGPVAQDHAGIVRIHKLPVRFEDVLSAAFDGIRHCGATHASVVENLILRLCRLEPLLRRESDRRAVHALLERIGVTAEQELEWEEWRRIAPIHRRALAAVSDSRRRPRFVPGRPMHVH
jgi:uncharacterized membrane protein